MSGVAVIGELLNGYSPLTTLVPAERIKAGVLAQNIGLPAVAVTSISGVDRNILAAGDKRRVNERVQVTVLANSYRDKRNILQLVRRACADKHGDFANVTDVSVLTDGTGPDFLSDDAQIWMQSQDFGVSFNEPTA